jgi:hypothetical protein
MSTIPMTACEWRVGEPSLNEIRIVERAQRDGTIMYAVVKSGWVANKDREWEHEPIPSSRDEDFTRRCRFVEWEEAAWLAQHMAHEEGRS